MPQEKMNNAEAEIIKYFERKGAQYSHDDVLFILIDLSEGPITIHASIYVYQYLESNYSTVALQSCCETLSEFMAAFGIRKPEDIYTITKEQMWILFLQGHCMVEVSYDQTYYKYRMTGKEGEVLFISHSTGCSEDILANDPPRTIPEYWEHAFQFHTKLVSKGLWISEIES